MLPEEVTDELAASVQTQIYEIIKLSIRAKQILACLIDDQYTVVCKPFEMKWQVLQSSVS
jgi:hypothetical protein